MAYLPCADQTLPAHARVYGDPETPRRIAEEVNKLSLEILPANGSPASPATTTAAPALDPSSRRTGRARAVSTPPHWITGFSRVKYGTPSTASTENRPVGLEPWPPPNLWPGVSVEDQNRIARLNDLLKTPAATRWVCFEPHLDRVMPEAVPVGAGYFDALSGGHYTIDGRGRAVAIDGPAWQPLGWVVVVGEIGPGARPTHPDWLRVLRDQCIAAGIPFFFRQWGEWAPLLRESPVQSLVRVGKRAAGRLLDGRSWVEMPETVSTR